MRGYTTKEAAQFFRSYGTDCDEAMVEKWIDNTPAIAEIIELMKATFSLSLIG